MRGDRKRNIIKSLINEFNLGDKKHIYDINNFNIIKKSRDKYIREYNNLESNVNDDFIMVELNYIENDNLLLKITYDNEEYKGFLLIEHIINFNDIYNDLEYIEALNIINKMSAKPYSVYREFLDTNKLDSDYNNPSIEEVIINNNKHIIYDDIYDHIKRVMTKNNKRKTVNKIVDFDEKSKVEEYIFEKHRKLLIKNLLKIYLYEHAIFEYIDNNKLIMFVKDITYELPIKTILNTQVSDTD